MAEPKVAPVAGYKPRYVSTQEEARATFGHLLQSLVGARIARTWVLWDLEDDTFFADAPVLLEIEGGSLEGEVVEVCWNKLADLSITLSTVDLEVKPIWFGMDDLDLAWREDALPELAAAVGKEITGVAFSEYHLKLQAINGPNAGAKSDSWIFNGVGLRFDERELWIYNALDENGVTDRLGAECRMTTTEQQDARDTSIPLKPA